MLNTKFLKRYRRKNNISSRSFAICFTVRTFVRISWRSIETVVRKLHYVAIDQKKKELCTNPDNTYVALDIYKMSFRHLIDKHKTWKTSFKYLMQHKCYLGTVLNICMCMYKIIFYNKYFLLIFTGNLIMYLIRYIIY